MTVEFDLRFDGLDAKDHLIDMKQLGRSMLGFERAVSDSLFLATEGRLPHFRERKALTVRVSAPRAACVELHAVVDTASGVLPLAFQILKAPGTKFIFEFLSFLLKLKGGKPKEADEHLMEAYRLLIDDRKEERATTAHEASEWRTYSLELADRLTWHLREAVAPVGETAETLTLPGERGGRPQSTVIDVPMAEAIRSKEPLEVGEMTKMRVRVDGIIKHTRQLKVELENMPGVFVNAEVRDPAFDERPNIYTEAVGNDDYLEVDAKPTFRNGELYKLHIMNAA